MRHTAHGENMNNIQRHDYLIIGAGPAGIQLGYFMEQNKQDYLILDAADEVGSFFAKYPRRRGLISFNKVHTLFKDEETRLRWDWNSLLTDDYSFPFREYSEELYPHADDLVRYLRDFKEHFNIKVRNKTRVTHIEKDEAGHFQVKDSNGNHFSCRALILASGFAKPFLPPVEGIDLVTESYENVTLDEKDFRGQRVLIIGKGNSAFEIADYVMNTSSLVHLASPESIRFAWNTRFAGHLRADYTRILDSYQLKLLNGSLDCQILNIKKEDDVFVVTVEYTHANGEIEELVYDRVIRCAGFVFDRSIFHENCCPDAIQSERIPESTSSWESSNVPNLFIAGTLMQYRDLQKSASAFIDGFRYNVRTLFYFLRERFQGVPYPCKVFEADVETIYENVIARINTTSALWAQFSYLSDVLIVNEAVGEVSHIQEVPFDYVPDSELSQNDHYYIITFEWGPWEGDVFAIERQPASDTAFTNAFLHPIIRRYHRDRCIATHHVLEDLLGVYSASGETGTVRRRSNRKIKTYHDEEHTLPLKSFFAEQIGDDNSPYLRTKELAFTAH